MRNDAGGTADCFRYALQGWATMVMPHCPSRDLVDTPEYLSSKICELLRNMIMLDKKGSPLHPTPIALYSELVPMWPTIWFWLKSLYRQNVQVRQILTAADRVLRNRRHTLILNAMRSFTYHNPPSKLSIVVRSTPGTMVFLATIWIEEAQNTEALFGFEAARLINLEDPLSFPEVTLQVLKHIILCCGSADAAVTLLFQRVHRNIGQASPCYGSLSYDIQLIIDQILDEQPTDCILHKALLLHDKTVPNLIQALLSLLQMCPAQPAEHLALMLSGPLFCIAAILSAKGANTAKMVDQLLATRFLISMPHILKMCKPDTQLTSACWAILHDILPSYGIFRTRLLQMTSEVVERGLGPLFDKNFKPGALAFGSSMAQWTTRYQQYKKKPVYAFSCGNLEVSKNYSVSFELRWL